MHQAFGYHTNKMDVNKVTPVQRMQLPRFTAHRDWLFTDVSVDSTRVAVSGYNYYTRTTSIDLFTLDVSDSTPLKQHQRPIFSREFPPVGDSTWRRRHRYVSLIDGDSSHIVTVYGSQLDLYNIHSNDDHRTAVTYRDGVARCVAVSETGDIYIGLRESNEVIVFDGELNIIKSITLNGRERDWPEDITVKNNNLFISTGRRALRYNMDGELLNQYNEPDQYISFALSITVSSEAGLVFVLWWGSPRSVSVFSLAGGHSLFSFVVDVDLWPIIRLSPKGNRLIVATEEGELIVCNTPKIFPFYIESLKEILSDFLSLDDCQQLGNFFELSSQEVDAVTKSQSPVRDLINALEEREIVYSANISRLHQALCHLELNDKAICSAELYIKYSGEETLYERFLAALSSHLTLSVPERLCEYFKLGNLRKGNVTASQSPGLTLLTVLDKMGLIHQFDVNALIPPLKELQLVQAVAKVEAYQSLIIESKQMEKTPISTLEGKRMLFIECVRKKIKTWYETMTHIPWRKSCKWTSAELFVPCGLILTRTSVELKVGNIHPDCKLHYKDIFTHNTLKSETRIIIEGGSGSGKTMLLSQLAYDWSINNIHDVNIVIFLPLAFLKDMTIFEAIEKFYVPNDEPLNADDIETLLNQASDESKACILLDGLEVYNGRRKDGGPSEVVKVMKKGKLSYCRVVLSSCSDVEQDLFECPRLRLRQFSEEERNIYIGNVFPDNKEKQETVKNAIRNSAFLQDLCTSPLLLIFVVHNMKHLVQYESSGRQKSLGALMQVFIDALVSHAHLGDREQSQSQVQSAKLSEIAFNGLCKGYRQLHWQKSFLDRTVSDMKEWTESGILVAQDDLMIREEQQLKYQGETTKHISTSASVDAGEPVDASIWKTIQSQRKSKLDRDMWSISSTSEQEMCDLSDMEEELLEAEKQKKNTFSRQSGYKGKVKQHKRKQTFDRKKSLLSETSESEMIDVIGKDKDLYTEDLILQSSASTPQKHTSTSAFADTGGSVDAPIWTKIQSQMRHMFERAKQLIFGTSEQKYELSDSEDLCLSGLSESEELHTKVKKVKQHLRMPKLDREQLLISDTSESKVIDVIGKSKLQRKDRILSSSTGIEIKPLHLVSGQSKTVPFKLEQKETSSTRLHNVFLQIKFVNEVFQEWFAAIHISSILKDSDEDNQEVFLNKHLPLINPSDLHYVLRFTSYLCPESCHLIMEHLLSVYKQADGAVPEYILNCIFLCFAEVDSSARDRRMDNAVRQVCKNTVTILGEDSRLLQQSKVSLLTYASDAEINIEHLKLMNVVAEISESVIIFNSGITLPTLHHLKAIEVSRWDQKLQKEYYKNLMVFLSKCQSLEEAQLIFPNLPPELPERQLFLATQQKMTVNWNIGKHVRYTLNMETEMWKLEVRRPSRVSNTSDVSATQLTVNENGGVVSIPDTGVELEIPSGALTEATLIRIRIIPHHFQDDKPLSFGSNSSVVVELLPSKLKLLKPTKLTLPHCLVLKKGLTWTAKVYSSHHEEGKPPQWEEEKSTHFELGAKTCVVWLQNFSWKKIEVGDGEFIEAKEILLYAARRITSTNTTVYVDVGYCMNLPRALEDAISTTTTTATKDKKILLHDRPALFYRDGGLPLKILFDETNPPNWQCTNRRKNKEISFREFVSQKTDFYPFVFAKVDSEKGGDCTCFFRAGQEGSLKDLVFDLQECEAEAASSCSGLPGSSLQSKKKKRKSKKKKSKGSEWSTSLQTEQSKDHKLDEVPTTPSTNPNLDCHVDNSTLWMIAQQIPNHWCHVSRNLRKIEEHDIDNVKADQSFDNKERAYQILLLWKQRNGKNAKYSDLKEALSKAGRKDVSDELLP